MRAFFALSLFWLAACAAENSQDSALDDKIVERLLKLSNDRAEFRQRAFILYDYSECPSITPVSLVDLENEVEALIFDLARKLEAEPSLRLDLDIVSTDYALSREGLFEADCTFDRLPDTPEYVRPNREMLELRRQSAAELEALAAALKQKVES